ncbi:MAG: response regulator [Pseudomonadota bacterium]
MKKTAFSTEHLAGVLIGLLGALVVFRWLTDSAAIAALIPGSAQMGLNTPLMFLAAGFCLFFLQPGARQGAVLQLAWRGAVGLLLVLPLLVLVQHLFDVNLGIDFVRVPTVPTPSQPHPGRVAPNTCVGFLLAGVALLLLRRPQRSERQAVLLNFSVACVLVIGVAALVGFILKLEVLYRVAALNSMRAPTAVGMSALGIALWMIRTRLRDLEPGKALDSTARITVRAFVVVTLVALSAGAAGFAVMRDSYEQSITENMRLSVAGGVTAIANTLDTSLWFPRMAASRPAVREAMLGLERMRTDAALRARLLDVGESFMDAGISAIRFEDADGTILASSGSFMGGRARTRQPLTVAGQQAVLLWGGYYLLHTENLVHDGERVIGKLIAEQPLPILDKLLALIRSGSDSSDVLVCSLQDEQAACAPTRFYKRPFTIPMYKSDGAINLPVNRALLGQSGVEVARDLRGVPVFAAYAPVSGFGLALVVKTNVETLYEPLRQRANLLVLALVVLVVLGASMLMIQVRPLVARLVAEQRRTGVILENSGDAFVALDVDGRITDWNAQAERTFGWNVEQARGQLLSQLIIPPALRAGHDAGFARFARTGSGKLVNTRIEVTALCRDGREIPIELALAAFHNGEGYIATAFMRDITERRRLAHDLATRAAELELERDRAQAANRAKGEFVANMSHELRTPMNAVLGVTHLLAHTELKSEQKKYLDMIRSSGQSLLGIMNDILDFSKVEAGRMDLALSRFNLADVLAAVATIMSVNAGDKDLELAIGVEQDVPRMLIGDALRLQQVLVNLVGNAVKFTEQGEVKLMVSLQAREGERATLLFSVCDTGIGMDERQQARLFMAFTQGDSSTTRRFGGTGLGLTISKRLTELMGGTITLDSAPGQGTTFRVVLPLAVDSDQEDKRRPPAALGQPRVLIVDDHPTSRACLSQTVADWGLECACAASGEEAVALAAGTSFDVVLLDWQMPGMDGMATIAALRALTPGVRVPVALMVNAYGRGTLLGSAAATEVDSVLSKPITSSTLFDTLHELLVLRRDGAAAAARPVHGMQGPRLDGMRVLLAEDNELNQVVARGILERAGVRIDVVDNGAEALERLSAAPEAYDMVLMDIQMPLLDGYAATRRIRSELGLDLPVLAMTAGVTEEERQACREAGMDDLIAKPVEVDAMLATIARHARATPRLRKVAQPAPPAAPEGAATVSASELPVLNLSPLVDIAKGNRQHLGAIAQLVRRMALDSQSQFEQARQSWSSGTDAEAARMLHALRGGVGSVGAKRFAATCQILEKALKQTGSGDPEALFALAGLELDAAMQEARDWLDEYEKSE